MRVDMLSLAVIALISGGLTIQATSDVDRECMDAVERVRERIGDHLVRIERSLSGGRQAGPDKSSPGDTWVLIASEGMIMGLDRDGCVTSYDSSCGMSDLVALTGFSPVPGEPGDVIAMPEVVLGLTIIRTFELSPTLMGILSEINLENLKQPRATLSGGILVELGHGAYVAKVERLGQILIQARQLNMNIGRIDLRFVGQVVVECDLKQRGLDKEV